MLTLMRQHRKALQVSLILVVAAFIGSLFIFGSSGMGGGDRADTVATVNGEAIPVDRYQRAYQSYLNVYAQMSQRPITPEVAESLGLTRRVLDMLVQEAVIVQRARAEGLEASDEEVNAQVHTERAFQEDGRFTRRRFEDVLRRVGLNEARYVEDIRRELTVRKMQDMVRAGAKVSDAEVEQAFRLRREEVRVQWALVELAPLAAAATVSDESLKTYLAAHPDEFRQPERRRVQYVTLVQKDFLGPVADADVETYYREHAREFEAPRQARAAHVLARVPETGGSAAEDKARAKIADVIRRAKAGEDFARLARELSEDTASAPNGGDLGLVSQGEMVPQFEQALFALKKGEVSPEPVRTPFGFHAIKVGEVREGGKKPLKEVAGAIRDRLMAEAAEKAMRTRAEALRPPLQAAKDFLAEAKKLGLTPLESTLARVDRLAGLGGTDPLEEAAFALALGGVSPPVRTPAGLVVLKALETIPAGVPPLGEIRDKVAAAAKRQKAEAAGAERAKQLAADAKAGDFAAAARKAGAQTGETPRFSRAKPAEKLPGDALVAALQTPAGGLTEPVKTPQGYYVLKVLERVPPDPGALAGERDRILKEVLAQKQSLAWEAWVTGARAGAKVDVSGRLPSRRG
ncbi:MAG: peptidyl-prolyl cis-trans isomerase [Candidatus Rokubacteria bacterium]|nr:peptidyl-prolyl cis-trans isomerase [Candidatus Rokubacteria bacterium]